MRERKPFYEVFGFDELVEARAYTYEDLMGAIKEMYADGYAIGSPYSCVMEGPMGPFAVVMVKQQDNELSSLKQSRDTKANRERAIEIAVERGVKIDKRKNRSLLSIIEQIENPVPSEVGEEMESIHDQD